MPKPIRWTGNWAFQRASASRLLEAELYEVANAPGPEIVHPRRGVGVAVVRLEPTEAIGPADHVELVEEADILLELAREVLLEWMLVGSDVGGMAEGAEAPRLRAVLFASVDEPPGELPVGRGLHQEVVGRPELQLFEIVVVAGHQVRHVRETRLVCGVLAVGRGARIGRTRGAARGLLVSPRARVAGCHRGCRWWRRRDSRRGRPAGRSSGPGSGWTRNRRGHPSPGSRCERPRPGSEGTPRSSAAAGRCRRGRRCPPLSGSPAPGPWARSCRK